MAQKALGGSRIPAGKVSLHKEPAILGCVDPGPASQPEATIVVVPVMEGRVIRKLRIQCGCGRATEIECEYEEVKG